MNMALDTTTALIYRKMLFCNNDTTYEIPESLLAIHERVVKMMDGLGGRSRIDVPSAACVVLVWQQTTEEGQEFLITGGPRAEDIPAKVMIPGEKVDWITVAENTDVYVNFKDKNVQAKFLGEHDVNHLRVKIPGMSGKYRVVDRANVRLISAS